MFFGFSFKLVADAIVGDSAFIVWYFSGKRFFYSEVTVIDYGNCYKFEESDIFLYEHSKK